MRNIYVCLIYIQILAQLSSLFADGISTKEYIISELRQVYEYSEADNNPCLSKEIYFSLIDLAFGKFNSTDLENYFSRVQRDLYDNNAPACSQFFLWDILLYTTNDDYNIYDPIKICHQNILCLTSIITNLRIYDMPCYISSLHCSFNLEKIPQNFKNQLRKLADNTINNFLKENFDMVGNCKNINLLSNYGCNLICLEELNKEKKILILNSVISINSDTDVYGKFVDYAVSELSFLKEFISGLNMEYEVIPFLNKQAMPICCNGLRLYTLNGDDLTADGKKIINFMNKVSYIMFLGLYYTQLEEYIDIYNSIVWKLKLPPC